MGFAAYRCRRSTTALTHSSGACPAGELGEHLTEIADDGDMYREIFADLRGIDIDMDDLGPGGNLAGRGHRAVPYPGPRHDDEIGVPHGFVGRGAAVGPEHAEI